MGRRKIEIKAIKDDRNRSVTFLKRKGGLFKKAHELSVLCSVDVAVIIFGNNKKLYEYSSGDIGEILTRYQYYGGANEHKGPADFTGKGKDMDDDDDDDGSGMSHHGSVEPQMMPPQFQNQPAFQHIRHSTPSASPPIPNGVFPHHPQQRQHTPQPQGGPGPGSRPSSRNAPRRQSSNLVPQGPHHPPPQNGYAYMPNPAIYNPHNGPNMPPHPHGLPQHMQGPPMQAPPMQGPPGQGPQYPNYGPQQQHLHQQVHQQVQQQVQQIYAEGQRRTSMPPAFPQQERPPSRPESSPPQPQQQQIPQQQVKQEHEQQQSAPQQLLEPVKRMSVKSRSIFTPIDESRSILSQHWASSTSNAENPKSDTATSNNRSQSVDVGAVSRTAAQTKPPSPPQRPQTHNKNRNVSMSSMPDGFTPPSRTNSAQFSGGGGKRPVLKVQIPDEPSEGSNTATDNSSPRSSSNTAQRKSGQSNEHGSSVVLPPPSPSASALLSAGASGPPNPFARPHPVSQNSNNSNNNMIDTPVSALPSRFMTNEFLPSPSSFYPEWNFSGRESNTLPSPLNFATPVVGTGPSFLREDSGERAGERQGSQGGQGGINKRKTPEPEHEESGDTKRLKHDI
ncbi:transcription factor [Hyphodiscus hymeniophilus]|uniref:Transcription factor n=1 Tax=Hyphodiscus hymeniophilus TaxID=353542 RepID=A0A9P7AZL2_9HELO|nr:transcription factor [Hyphodiscus hymeniophilus]